MGKEKTIAQGKMTQKSELQETTTQQFSIDIMIQKGLQEQARQYNLTAVQDKHFYNALYKTQTKIQDKYFCNAQNKMHEKGAKNARKKHFQIKKTAAVVIAATVMVLGTISIAAGGIKSIVMHSLNIPDYKYYQDMETAAAEAGVQFNAPEQFANGYCFEGIYMVENQYKSDEKQIIDTFTSVQIRYIKDSETIILEIRPRPMISNIKRSSYTDIFHNDETDYYYQEMRNKWVPPDYKPTKEEEQAIAEDTLNIGYGALQISYSDSKSITWEIRGQQYMLFGMDNNISKEELYAMALEIE